jgi:hypothetical protein
MERSSLQMFVIIPGAFFGDEGSVARRRPVRKNSTSGQQQHHRGGPRQSTDRLTPCHAGSSGVGLDKADLQQVKRQHRELLSPGRC